MPHVPETSFFAHSLTYICEHSQNGAMGLVINRKINLTVGEIFAQMNIASNDHEIAHHPAYLGGPVDQEHGFVLHSSDVAWSNSIRTGKGVTLTSSREVLESLANGSGPKQAIVVLGYTGWTAGQLEHELQQNQWLTCQANPEIIFNVGSEKKLNAAAATLGIDLMQLSTVAGHA